MTNIKDIEGLSIDFDNISITTNQSIMDYTDFNRACAFANSNTNVLKQIFGVYEDFSMCKDEEELIFAIKDSTLVNWDEVSKIINLAEFIMDEFSLLINWTNIIFHRRMTKKTIIRFKEYLIVESNKYNFIKLLNNTTTNALYVICEVNSIIILSIYYYACHYNFIEIVKFLIKNPNIANYALDTGFTYAYQNNSIEVVKYLATDSRVTNDTIKHEFTYACANDSIEAVKYLTTDSRITENIIYNGFLHVCANDSIKAAKFLITDPHITDNILYNVFAFACENDAIEVVKYLATDPRITNDVITNGITHAYQNDSSEVVAFLTTDSRITNQTI